jgi:hypothetical protein
VRMQGVFERATWPLRKLTWLVEEKVLWPIADAIRKLTGRSYAHVRVKPEPVEEVAPNPLEAVAAPPLEAPAAQSLEAPTVPSLEAPQAIPAPSLETPAAPSLDAPAEAVDRRIFPRMRDRFRNRFGTSGRDVFVVLGTVAVALGVGIGVVAITGPHGSTPPAPSAAAPAASAPATTQANAAAAAQTAVDQTANLQGVTPNFKSSSNTAGSNAAAATDTQATTGQGTNAKPSSIPPGASDDATALHTAQNFASAFVLYEVGKSSPKVKRAFARTATPALAKALGDRPPRLPNSVKVPKAKVQNVVLGAKKGRDIDASVSLLRLGELSELRLTLSLRHGNWAVSEVRG